MKFGEVLIAGKFACPLFSRNRFGVVNKVFALRFLESSKCFGRVLKKFPVELSDALDVAVSPENSRTENLAGSRFEVECCEFLTSVVNAVRRAVESAAFFGSSDFNVLVLGFLLFLVRGEVKVNSFQDDGSCEV